jgi:kynurenine 3-monooxygenase
LDELEALPNVKFFFNHKMTGADFRSHKAWFEISGTSTSKSPAESRHREIEISFDFLIGADGAHSAARFHMMKFARMDYEQAYIDTLWCEFSMKPKIDQLEEGTKDCTGEFQISPRHLHIWPGADKMFIAIPSLVRQYHRP